MDPQDILAAAALEERITALLEKMTLKEKISLLSGRDIWYTVPVERLGIPSLVMTDGPHGVRASDPGTGRPVHPTTAFPTGISFSASWNPELVERVGVALGEETRAMDCDILLGPCINIVRTPLGGRNFETYSEDPYLAGRTGVAYVKGLQSQKVGASLKHYACNNQEIERDRSSSQVDERTLREIYLPAFEAVVKEARPWTVMCSYNRINGVYASQNDYLLNEILKREWGFDGFVVSDWNANHTIFESIQGGLDLEMPGPAKYYGLLLGAAVQRWQIDPATIDNSVRRILRIILRSGRMDAAGGAGAANTGAVNTGAVNTGAVNTAEHQGLARELAEEAITLLKNRDGLLPLDPGKIRSLAVIGPNAAEARLGGGGSSYVEPPYRVSPLEGLRRRFGEGVQIEFEPGCDNQVDAQPVKTEWLTLPDGSGQGLLAEYFNNSDLSGQPDRTRVEPTPQVWVFFGGPVEGIDRERWSARWNALLTVPTTGRYSFLLSNSGRGRAYLDGALLLENNVPDHMEEDEIHASGVDMALEAGRVYRLKIEYIKPVDLDFGHIKLALTYNPAPGTDDRLERAVALARRSDAAIIFAGMPEKYESEGGDRPNMELPGRQNELIRAVLAANPRTVVVLNAGAPVALPWLEEAPALLLAYYPGMEGGNAIARILAGDVSPSGKLPVTFPKRLQDTPAYTNSTYPGAREILYGEGIFVGYRWYDMRAIEPLFPFGFGLAYTEFEYGPLQVAESAKVGEPVSVSLTVTNRGARAGKEIVQLYVHDRQASLPRPPKELKGFQKVALEPGETKTVTFTLDERAFAFYHPVRKGWVAEPGEFELLAASSSRDIRSRATIRLE